MEKTILCFTALFAAYLGFVQYKTAADKLKLDLFDRRMKIFESIMEFYKAAMSKSDFSFPDLWQFFEETKRSQFLFGTEIGAFLTEVSNKAMEKIMINEEGKKDTLTAEERSALSNKKFESIRYFTDGIDKVNLRFLPYLSFRNVRADSEWFAKSLLFLKGKWKIFQR